MINYKFKTIKIVFFMSGIAALIYQIAWQRMLFTAFGVDLESITIIIAVFMAGLGIGAYYGGRIADYLPDYIILLFALIEVGIGTFGFMSPFLIEFVKELFLHADIVTVAFANFILLLFPTFLMGTTLPLLTQYLNKYINNVGDNIGWLYFTNTLGAASACLLTGFLLFNYFTLIEVIYFSVAINYTIAVIIFIRYKSKGVQND